MAAASAAGSPGATSRPHSSLTSSGSPTRVRGDDRHLHGQRLLGRERHRVAVAVGGDDATARRRRSARSSSSRACAGETAPSSSTPGAASSSAQRPVAGDHHLDRLADQGGGVHEVAQALLLRQPRDRHDRAPAGVRPRCGATAAGRCPSPGGARARRGSARARRRPSSPSCWWRTRRRGASRTGCAGAGRGRSRGW